MSSYQIKSTPYLRRIVSTSRNNGQLQDLREEYERIQEFNDRTIEMKMRQVRLKRLFRQIEGIKILQDHISPSSDADINRRGPFVVNPSAFNSNQKQRFEALARAREFGKEISRRNAQSLQQGGGLHRFGLRSSSRVRVASEARRAELERRERTRARITYGNAQSRCNIQKITQRRMRNRQTQRRAAREDSEITDNQPQPVESLTENGGHREKRSKLQQRLAYGNAQSFSNRERAAAKALRRSEAAAAMVNKYYDDGDDYDDDDANDEDPDTISPSEDDEYEQYRTAKSLKPKASPHDLCVKRTMILKRNVVPYVSDHSDDDDDVKETIIKTTRRGLDNWHRLVMLSGPWISALQKCGKSVNIFNREESGTNLFLSATDTTSSCLPKKVTGTSFFTSDSFKDVLSENRSVEIRCLGASAIASNKSIAIKELCQENEEEASPLSEAEADSTTATVEDEARVSIQDIIDTGEENSEADSMNSDEKYPNPDIEYFFDEYEEGLEAENPASGVEDPSSEADNVLSKIGTSAERSLIESSIEQSDQASHLLNTLAPKGVTNDANNSQDVLEDCMDCEDEDEYDGELWDAEAEVVDNKYNVPVKRGTVKRMRRRYERQH